MSFIHRFPSSPAVIPLYPGTYRVRLSAENAAGVSAPTEWSAPFTVVAAAIERPVITSFTESLTTAAGANVTLTVVASGATDYVWQNDFYGVWAGDKPGQTVTVQAPAAGSIRWRCAVSNAGGTVYTIPTAITTATSNPFAGRTFHVLNYNEPNIAAGQVASSNPTWVDPLTRIGAQPFSQWASWSGYNETYARRMRDEAGSKLTVVPIYMIPYRDNGSWSGGGFSTATAYRAFVDAILRGYARRPVVVIIEPDALALSRGMPEPIRGERITLLKETTQKFAAEGHHVYMDAGGPRWHGGDPQRLVSLLREVDAHVGRGFALNVSNMVGTPECENFGNQVSAAYGGSKPLKFLIDTGRNGRGPWENSGVSEPYLNPLYRATGLTPRAVSGATNCDAYCWVKTPGGSDAANGRREEDGSIAPGPGSYWPAAGYGMGKRGIEDGRL